MHNYQPSPDYTNITTHRGPTAHPRHQKRNESPTLDQNMIQNRPRVPDESGINYPYLGHWTYNNLSLALLIANIILAGYLGILYLRNASTLTDEITSGSWHSNTISRDVDLSFNRQRLKTEEVYDTKTTEILAKISSESNSIRNSYSDKIGDVEKEINYQASKIASLERKVLDLTRSLKLAKVIMPCGEETNPGPAGE